MYFSGNRNPIQTIGDLGRIRPQFIRAYYRTATISCRIPKEVESLVPRAVFLQKTSDCPKKAHNSLRVIYEMPNKTRDSFAVCLNPLRYSRDLSLKLIEWLELLRILGVSKVFIPLMSVHKNMERVLKYYQKTVINFKHKIYENLKLKLLPLFMFLRVLSKYKGLPFLENSQTLSHFMGVTAKYNHM